MKFGEEEAGAKERDLGSGRLSGAPRRLLLPKFLQLGSGSRATSRGSLTR